MPQTLASPDQEDEAVENLSPEAKEEICNLTMTLQKSKLQESRMSNFAFEAVSLPTSRVGHNTLLRSLGGFHDRLHITDRAPGCF
jgi:hypothetical protein